MTEWSSIKVSKETKKALDEMLADIPFIGSYENFFKYLKLGFELYPHIKARDLIPDRPEFIHIADPEVD